jgi:predicted unusual protein kinase regulating ubiquinone biosynthesis (AarF/ABC1/UbiB family)
MHTLFVASDASCASVLLQKYQAWCCCCCCRIPPYFALIIRAIGVLEGIALVGDPEFALVDEAYPYIAKRLLTDPSPRLQVRC